MQSCEIHVLLKSPLSVYALISRTVVSISDGPENIILIPGNESYTVHAGDNFPNVKCQADCYPGCDYRWYKDSTFLTLSTTLVLGVLNDTDAAIYHCVVNRSVTVLRKSFKMNVICR